MMKLFSCEEERARAAFFQFISNLLILLMYFNFLCFLICTGNELKLLTVTRVYDEEVPCSPVHRMCSSFGKGKACHFVFYLRYRVVDWLG